MPDIFVDTAGWVSYFDRSQPQHEAATTFIGVCLAQGQRLITTNYVMTEVVALLMSRTRVSHSQIVNLIDTLKIAPYLEIVHIDTSLDAEAWEIMKARQDKDWSLVDCSSFVVMQKRSIVEALTTDRNFEQAGFVRLLKS